MYRINRRHFLGRSAGTAMLAAASAQGIDPLFRSARAATQDAQGFRVGVATRDITPPPGVPLWGYSSANRPAEGTLDPLYAKAIVFEVEDTCIGLVVLDLGRMPSVDVCNRIRVSVRDRGINEVTLMATHTHSAPFMEIPGPSHVDGVAEGIVEALLEAKDNARPAKIGIERCTIDISHNRRLIKDGKCYMMWRNAGRKPTSPVDHEAAIIRIDGQDGAPMATLVHYACHPVVFGPDSKQYSADWCGEMCRIVKGETGAECLFLQGGAGDINPYLDKTQLAEGGVEAMRGVGAEAAKAVLSAHKTIKTAAPAAPSVAYASQRFDVGTRWDLSDPTQTAILKEVYGPMFDLYMEGFAKDPGVPLSALVLNNDIALSFMPGELFVQFQLDLKARSPIQNSLLCGYADEFHIYFPTIRDAAIGGYGASTATYVGLGAGELLIAEAMIMIGRLTGQLHALRGPEDFELLEL